MVMFGPVPFRSGMNLVVVLRTYPNPWHSVQVYTLCRPFHFDSTCPVPLHRAHSASYTYVGVWQNLTSGSQVSSLSVKALPLGGRSGKGVYSDKGMPSFLGNLLSAFRRSNGNRSSCFKAATARRLDGADVLRHHSRRRSVSSSSGAATVAERPTGRQPPQAVALAPTSSPRASPSWTPTPALG